jgi:hypothetical protein
VSCLAVRDRLAEHALGVLPGPDLAQVDRHLAWCAACRKEADGLGKAASSLVFALAPVEPSADLEERVVEAVSHAAGGHRAGGPRRGRLAVAAVVAAMLALSGLGWGAVMAGRASRLEERIKTEGQSPAAGVDNVVRIFQTLEFSDGWARVGALSATGGGPGRGGAMTFTSDSIRDIAIVDVLGLRSEGAPYIVELVRRDGEAVTVGRIKRLDADGGATIVRRFGQNLEGFNRLVVRDSKGAVVVVGTLAAATELASPSPSPYPGR